MDTITSRHNPRFKDLARLREDKDVLLLEGRRLVEEAVRRGLTPIAAAVTPEYINAHGAPDFPHLVVLETLLPHLAATKTPQGIVMFVERPYATLATVARHDRLIILDGLQDPGNVGTIVRTAEVFAIRGLIITPGTASPFSDKAVRASMGSFLGVDIAQATPDAIKTLDHTIISLALQAPNPLTPGLFQGRTAVCLGQEGAGISPELLALSHITVSIPMPGPTESLNVAVAAGIVMSCMAGTW